MANVPLGHRHSIFFAHEVIMEVRDGRTIIVSVSEFVGMIVGEAKKKPGTILPDPIPKISAAQVLAAGNEVRLLLTFEDAPTVCVAVSTEEPN